MIDWYGVFRNACWIFGLAVALAAFSYTDWQRGMASPKLSLRQALGRPNFQAPFSLGMVLFAAGLALSSDRWWEIAAWAVLGVLFAWQALAAYLELNKAANGRIGESVNRQTDESETQPGADQPDAR